ncbi:hypothetical protein MKW92_037805, partial [Papaver armeniacum]
KVESIIPRKHRLIINRNQETARDIFTREHKGLVKEAEKHMQSTASSLMLAAFLICVPMYAAVLPRAYNSSTNIFVILALYLAANLSLISATAFIVISLTSCYGEENFLTSLPQMLVIGIATLMFSLVMMMAACTAEIYSRVNQVGGIVLAFAFIPVLVLAFSLMKLLITEMFSSYGRSGLTSRDQDKLLHVARKNYYEVRCIY